MKRYIPLVLAVIVLVGVIVLAGIHKNGAAEGAETLSGVYSVNLQSDGSQASAASSSASSAVPSQAASPVSVSASSAASLPTSSVTESGVSLETYIEKVIEIAEQQPQYPVENGKTVYGQLFGTPYSQWCTEFVMYCLKNAEDELGTEFIGEVYPWRDSAYATGLWFKRQNRYYDAGGDYIPQRGDLMIFDSQELGYPNHVAMVTGTVTENGRTYVVTIEGNIPEDDVKQIRSRKLLLSDPIIMAYLSTTVETPYEGSLTDYS